MSITIEELARLVPECKLIVLRFIDWSNVVDSFVETERGKDPSEESGSLGTYVQEWIIKHHRLHPKTALFPGNLFAASIRGTSGQVHGHLGRPLEFKEDPVSCEIEGETLEGEGILATIEPRAVLRAVLNIKQRRALNKNERLQRDSHGVTFLDWLTSANLLRTDDVGELAQKIFEDESFPWDDQTYESIVKALKQRDLPLGVFVKAWNKWGGDVLLEFREVAYEVEVLTPF